MSPHYAQAFPFGKNQVFWQVDMQGFIDLKLKEDSFNILRMVLFFDGAY